MLLLVSCVSILLFSPSSLLTPDVLLFVLCILSSSELLALSVLAVSLVPLVSAVSPVPTDVSLLSSTSYPKNSCNNAVFASISSSSTLAPFLLADQNSPSNGTLDDSTSILPAIIASYPSSNIVCIGILVFT